MTTREELDALYSSLYETARGDSGKEAAIDLIYRHDRWLSTLYAWGWIEEITEENPQGDEDFWFIIRWSAVAAALDTEPTGDEPEAVRSLLVGSGSERAILRVACSLAVNSPVGLRGALAGLDNRNLALALHGIVHASQGESAAHRLFPLSVSGAR